jgi:colanic acid biosynthesis glycosyl transferase WcaI
VFVVCGDGAMKPQLEEAARQLPNLLLLPLQPFERLGFLLGLADMHLLPQSPEAEDLVLPSKLTGMLASGRPVIATCRAGTEIATVVNECGLVVPPGDGAALATAIERLADDDDARLRLGGQARLYAEKNLARDAVLGRLVKQMASSSL